MNLIDRNIENINVVKEALGILTAANLRLADSFAEEKAAEIRRKTDEIINLSEDSPRAKKEKLNAISMEIFELEDYIDDLVQDGKRMRKYQWEKHMPKEDSSDDVANYLDSVETDK